MALKARIAAAAGRYPRLTRAAGWALLGGAMAMSGWTLVNYVDSLDIWLGEGSAIGPFYVSPLGLIVGSLHIVVPAAGAWLAGHAGGLRAVGFALLAMFWLNLGPYVANLFLAWESLGFGEFDLAGGLIAGFSTASLWVAAAGLLTLPSLRSRRAIAWLLGAGAGFTVLSPGLATAIDYIVGGWLDWLPYTIAAWAAVQAAAFSLALPPREP